MTPDQPPAHPVAEPEQAPIPMCGLVMPISGTPDHPRYTADHWLEVRYVIDAAVKAAGFHPRLVSEGDSSGLIHGRIVQNLGDCPMVVCDVSSRNPNVMFELGLRLQGRAFNKPSYYCGVDVRWCADSAGTSCRSALSAAGPVPPYGVGLVAAHDTDLDAYTMHWGGPCPRSCRIAYWRPRSCRRRTRRGGHSRVAGPEQPF